VPQVTSCHFAVRLFGEPDGFTSAREDAGWRRKAMRIGVVKLRIPAFVLGCRRAMPATAIFALGERTRTLSVDGGAGIGRLPPVLPDGLRPAKRAEACNRFELGVPQSNYSWAKTVPGSKARGSHVLVRIREQEYFALLLDPSALVTLKLTGSCLINGRGLLRHLSSGHYMRRIRIVTLTILRVELMIEMVSGSPLI
jgi:hypothetical protein